MSLAQSSTQLEVLTPREREVAGMVAGGMLHKQVAFALNISPETVSVHVRAAARKLPGPGLPTRKLTRLSFLFQSSDSEPEAA